MREDKEKDLVNFEKERDQSIERAKALNSIMKPPKYGEEFRLN